MFKDVGKKLMNMASVIFWIGTIGFASLGISIIVLSQNTYDSATKSQLLTSGITTIVAGFIGSLIGSMCLYGFGQLIDDNARSRSLLEKIAGNQRPQSNPFIQSGKQSATMQSQFSVLKTNDKPSTSYAVLDTNPYIDQSECISCEMCVSTCPELFKMDANNKAVVISDITAETWKKGHEAIDNCPVQAIHEK